MQTKLGPNMKVFPTFKVGKPYPLGAPSLACKTNCAIQRGRETLLPRGTLSHVNGHLKTKEKQTINAWEGYRTLASIPQAQPGRNQSYMPAVWYLPLRDQVPIFSTPHMTILILGELFLFPRG